MDSFLIQGPGQLNGSIAASGAKNAALPALAACLLTDEDVELERLPQVRDVITMGRVLEHLGAEVTRSTDATPTRVRCHALAADREAPYELVKTMRASVLVLGPLVARLGYARVSLPGGCAIGARPIDLHLAGLEAMGAEVELDHGYVTVRARGGGAKPLAGCRYRFAMPSVGATENLMMAATLAQGTTVLDNCAQEPEISDLATLLRAMGAQISGAGSATITIEGVDRLTRARHALLCDRIEAGTYLIGGVMTNGSVTVTGLDAVHLTPLLEKLSDCGANISVADHSITASGGSELKARDMITAPHPGFPTDLQAQFLALMTRAEGTSTIVESVFENRFQHVPELRRMGAEISIDGNAARVTGCASLTGATVMATDLRASACLVLAGLCAQGDTTVDRIYHLDRGYERMESKLQTLGVPVQRIE